MYITRHPAYRITNRLVCVLCGNTGASCHPSNNNPEHADPIWVKNPEHADPIWNHGLCHIAPLACSYMVNEGQFFDPCLLLQRYGVGWLGTLVVLFKWLLTCHS
ncbi:MAG: hypothetical protein EA411_08010 [Saprospirales bacterium]|nr:MAG: hypothetical protein EA411_08010 [Saprospirales bacterium]